MWYVIHCVGQEVFSLSEHPNFPDALAQAIGVCEAGEGDAAVSLELDHIYKGVGWFVQITKVTG